MRYADHVKERNNVTGQLSTTMAVASKIEKKSKNSPSRTTILSGNDDNSRDSKQVEPNTDDYIENEMEDDDDNW